LPPPSPPPSIPFTSFPYVSIYFVLLLSSHSHFLLPSLSAAFPNNAPPNPVQF
jgi:hypothetical protein